MIFCGWEPVSLIEFPDHISAVLFTGGCNFRCPFCHNVSLVLAPETQTRLPAAQVLQGLEQRRGLVDGVVVTGGEPTLHGGLVSFLRQVRRSGWAIKLDTNGSRPAVLRCLLDEQLVDYVAMDIKAPPGKYPLLAGTPAVNLRDIEQSIAMLQGGQVACEFRTTLVPGLLGEQDVEAIGRWIAGAKRYVLQQFRPGPTLSPELAQAVPYPMEYLQSLAGRMEMYFKEVIVRGDGRMLQRTHHAPAVLDEFVE